MTRLRLTIICIVAILVTSHVTMAQTSDTRRVDAYTLSGELSADTPTVDFPITIRRSETTLLAELTITNGGSIPIIQLLAPSPRRENGEQLLASNASARLEHKVMGYGEYILRISANDESNGQFEINVRIVEEVIEANLVSVIDDDSPFHTIPIDIIQTGTSIEIDLREITAEGGLDTKLYLVEDRTNTIIASNDDRDRVNGDKSSYIFFPEAARGSYRIIATRYNETRGTTSGEFRLFFNLIPPSLRSNQTRNFRVSAGGLLDAGFPVIPERAETTWTVFAYYGGDNDLEAAIINDLNEFEIAGSTQNVRIVVLLDRSSSYDESNGDWQGARLFEVGPAENDSGDHVSPQNPDGNNPATIDTPHITELGIVNTGDGELFAQFLVWGIRNYPSDNYVVAIGSHGAGWYGVVTDDTHNSIIPVQDVQQALNLALAETDLDKFAFLINDACFMSSVEYFDAISPYFDYSIASPEIVVNPGHDMTMLINLMNSQWQDPSFVDIGSQLVAKYINTDILLRPGSDVFFLTSALTDLNSFDPVTVAVEEFAAIINERNPVLVGNLLGTARSRTYTYQHFMRSRTSKTSNRMIDLADFMRRIIENRNADEEITRAAENVIQSLNRTRLYAEGGERVENLVGYYNVYFPERSDDFDTSYFDQSPLKEWGRMLRNYYNVVTPTPWEGDSIFHTPAPPVVNIITQYPLDPANVSNPSLVEAEVIGRNITGVTAVYDRIEADGLVVRYAEEQIFNRETNAEGSVEFVNSWDSGYQLLAIFWDVTLPVVTDGTNSYSEMLSISDQTASIDAVYCPPNRVCEQADEWESVVITFNRDDGSLQRVVSLSQSTNGAGVIEIIPGSTVQTFRHIVTSDGQTRPEQGNTYIWPEDGMRWTWRPAPDGEYNIGYEITAFGGTTGYATAPFTIAGNAELPIDMLSYYRSGTGFLQPYRLYWSEPPAFSGLIPVGETGFVDYSIAPDGDLRTRIYINYVDLPSLEDTVAWGRDEVGLEIVGETRAVTIKGEPALEFDMRFTEADGSVYIGRAFAVRIKDQDYLTVIASAEALEGTDYEAHYDFLKTYFGFVDEGYLDSSRTSSVNWVRTINGNIYGDAYALYTFSNWETTVDVNSVWSVRSAPSPDSPQFFTTGTFNLNANIEGSVGVLSNVLLGYALEDAEQLTVTNTNTLYGQYLTWEAVSYTVIRDGAHLSGRMYTIPIENRTFAAWFETPMLETADGFVEDIETIRSIFEPILDGYQIIPASQMAGLLSQAG